MKKLDSATFLKYSKSSSKIPPKRYIVRLRDLFHFIQSNIFTHEIVKYNKTNFTNLRFTFNSNVFLGYGSGEGRIFVDVNCLYQYRIICAVVALNLEPNIVPPPTKLHLIMRRAPLLPLGRARYRIQYAAV